MEEVGRNMTYFEYCDHKSPHNGEIIIIDMGLQFPEENMPGIDYVVPNVSSLVPKKDKILGAIISHGHYDHIGAIPYINNKIGNPPIFTMPLTRGIILKRQEDFPHLPKLEIHQVSTEKPLKLGVFELEFFHVNHNIFDAVGTAVHSPVGTIIHTGDFKIDNNPVGDKPADYAKMAALSQKGITLLMSESTNAEKEGHSISEGAIRADLESIMEKSKGRVIVSTFSSLLSRVQQLVSLAEKYGRKVAFDGYSMKTNVAIANELGYLKFKKETLINVKDLDRYSPDKVMLICTGAQGEGSAVLMRIAQKEHRFVKLREGDAVIFSSSVVPGNERGVQSLKDVIYRQDAKVYHYQMMDIHAGGHGRAEDLKMMISLMHPKFFMPIYGNYYMLRLHAELAETVGIPKENMVIPSNGSVVKLSKDKIQLTNQTVDSSYVMVDGLGIGDVQEVVLRDRQMLSEDGIFVIIAAVDSSTGKVKGSPDIISRGFVYLRESKELLKSARIITRKVIEEATANMHPVNWDYIKNSVRDRVGKFLFQKTSRRPMVLPVVIEV
ncbi:MAG: hypothetical protein A2909_00325 [Candidatus Tagabacteria bacterium RIFCSPLOWO2_01_FULL_39_11]|uniref:Ribonuclease J n=1 Tax=Candidatus Tagabacteria bacterium RIFCSPLOWO2_01_FULL_39_11 TaxID=1802295 RepID=A0A1G2LRN8_9BACT|nr:MAG: hypothetical protein A2909_00325 [Candidatus Tagabacteria bacterium RIFCSPLOWO2_01_FULL_39_11]